MTPNPSIPLVESERLRDALAGMTLRLTPTDGRGSPNIISIDELPEAQLVLDEHIINGEAWPLINEWLDRINVYLIGGVAA